MRSEFEVCAELKPRQRCIRVRKYESGLYSFLFHQHVPEHRLSNKAVVELLRTLVVSFAGFTPEFVVASYLNKRGSEPTSPTALQIFTHYPADGVLRTMCGGNIEAWEDRLIAINKA